MWPSQFAQISETRGIDVVGPRGYFSLSLGSKSQMICHCSRDTPRWPKKNAGPFREHGGHCPAEHGEIRARLAGEEGVKRIAGQSGSARAQWPP
jgi:hypothetical protein